jgi:hypothetical protein
VRGSSAVPFERCDTCSEAGCPRMVSPVTLTGVSLASTFQQFFWNFVSLGAMVSSLPVLRPNVPISPKSLREGWQSTFLRGCIPQVGVSLSTGRTRFSKHSCCQVFQTLMISVW